MAKVNDSKQESLRIQLDHHRILISDEDLTWLVVVACGALPAAIR